MASKVPSQPPLPLNLWSRDRSNPTQDAANSTFQLTSPVAMVTGVVMKSNIIPTTLYNVSAAKANNTFYVSYGSGGSAYGPTLCTIPDGQYTPVALASQLQTLLNANCSSGGASWTVTFSTTTLKYTYTITGTSTPTFLISGVVISNAPTAYIQMGLIGGANTFANAAGSSTTSSGVSPNVPQLSYPEIIFCRIREFPFNVNWTNATSAPGLQGAASHFAFPMRQTGGALQYNSFDTYEAQKVCFHGSTATLYNLHVDFFDAEGTSITFNGADWALELYLQFGCICDRKG